MSKKVIRPRRKIIRKSAPARKKIYTRPWWLARLDVNGVGMREWVIVHVMRRQCKANGRHVRFMRCRLWRRRIDGEWWFVLEGAIKKEHRVRVRELAGDYFMNACLWGWEVCPGRLGEDPKHDYLWIPGPYMERALAEFGWRQ